MGYFASSKAGHDREKIYLIIREDEKNVYLADGQSKSCRKPKKKNRKHIQVIKGNLCCSITQKLRSGEMLDDMQVLQEVRNVKSRCN